MADIFAWAVRFLHILAGVIWVGGSFTWAMVIAPNVLQRAPPIIRRPFLEAALRPFTRLMIISGGITILTGFWVMGILVGFSNISQTFQSPPYGLALGVGAAAAFGIYAAGLFVIRPTAEKLLATLQSLPAPAPGAPPSQPSAEVQAQLAGLGKRIAMASMASLVLGTIALAAMAWAVNVVR